MEIRFNSINTDDLFNYKKGTDQMAYDNIAMFEKSLTEADMMMGLTVESKSKPGPNTHKVKKGESLSVIAERNGITVDELKKANGLKNDNVREGQVLKIPTKSKTQKTDKKSEKSNNKTHKVKLGESLSIIAERNGITVDDLKKANGLKNDNIQEGQILKIPAVKTKKEKVESKPQKEKQDNQRIHTVQSGDTISRISREYGIPQSLLMRKNNIKDPSKLRLNQKLIIPVLLSDTLGITESTFNQADSNYVKQKAKLTSAMHTALNNSKYKNDGAAMEFFKRLAFMESSFDLYPYGGSKTFVGLYQIGPEMCNDTKYKYKNLNGNPGLQQATLENFLEIKGSGYIKQFKLDKYIGKTISVQVVSEKGGRPKTEKVKITAAALFAGMHLVGIGGLIDTLKGKLIVDGNGISGGAYMKMMQDVESKALTDLLS